MSYRSVKRIVNFVNLSQKTARVHTVRSALTPTTTPTFTQLNAIAEGKTDLTRVGRTIFLVSQRIQAIVIPAGTSIIRIMLVSPKQKQVQTLVVGDIVDINDTQLSTYETPKLVNGKFKVIWDKVASLDNNEDQKILLDKHHFKKGTKLAFSGTTGTTCLRPLFLYMVTNGTMTQPTVQLTTELWFRDEEVNQA